MSENYIFNIIKKYNIEDKQEIRALTLYYYWIINIRKIFPDMRHGKFNENKDPRSLTIFRYCYKLQRENPLEEKNYENYIRAQLIILKYLSQKYNRELVVDANCICGDKAWKRWQAYKIRLIKTKNDSVNTYVSFPNLYKLEKELNNTKDFLKDNIENIDEESLKANIESIIVWFNLRKINPYFIILNKNINNNYDYEYIRKNFKIDPILYLERTNDRIKELYFKIFKESPFTGEKND
jgi:hypothetical protein